MNYLRLPLFREITASLLMACLLLQSATAVAPGPAWWDSQSVADPDALPDDFAVANVGQLKYMAAKAAAALEAEFPGGAGSAINALVASWNSPVSSGVTRDDYLAVNQGQLKAVASLFYDRLGQPYPWAGSSATRDDYQAVNLGQLKHVFAFELKFRSPGTTTQIPTATLAAALAQWQALPVKPAGSSTDDFDGDGIPNLQEYLMGRPLFDPLDIDGDRILDSVEDAHPGVLSKLRFTDAVEDYDGDGVMNYEELLLGLNPAAATTSGRADDLGDAEVLAWSLAASATLTANTDAVRALWEVIDADWIDREAGSYYLYWLVETPVDGVPAGLTSFRADVATWAWQPWNPSVWSIENPPLAHDPNWDPVDLDGNGVADFDRDNDNLPDLWEYRYSLNLRDGQDANSDPDGDQLPNWQEYQNGTNPFLADSDGDGFADRVELLQGGDPVQQSIAPPLMLQVVGSSYQAIYTGQTTPALAVKVTQGGLPVAGVSVAFAVSAGSGRLKPASSVVGTPGASLSQTTASDGMAAVTYESAAGEPEGTASVTTGLAGAAVAQTFTVSIVAIPAAYGSATGGDSTTGASGGLADNPTRVPTPPRSTAMSATEIAAATADRYRIRVKRRFNTDLSYPKIDAFPEYLTPYGMNPAALVGWQDPFEIHTWADYTQLEFEALPFIAPLKKQVVPTGARSYLVLVYQGENAGSDSSGPPKYVGVLTFQYSDMGARMITLTGGIPDPFVKTDGSTSVTIEPPLATKAAERVWISLEPMMFITPAGDPVNAPIDAGTIPANTPDGANEFTFSNATTGVLTLKLKVRNPGVVDQSATDQAKYTFGVDAIGNSVLSWGTENPGGKAKVDGEYLTATAIFTGLPQNNSDFGLKTARLKFDGNELVNTSFEVFFKGDATNHPGKGAGTDPNWFYYWGQIQGNRHLEYGGVGPGPSAKTPAGEDWSYFTAVDKQKIIAYDSIVGKFSSYSVGKVFSGIDRFFGTVIHEERHVDQIARADALLVQNGVAGTPWRLGWSFFKADHNHWAVGIDNQPGKAGVDDDGDNSIDNFITFGSGELGKGPVGSDKLLSSQLDPNWPDAWPLPQHGGMWPASLLECDAIEYSDSNYDENKNARNDWGNPGKNHQTLDKWND